MEEQNTYLFKIGKDGRVMWTLNGKRIAKKDVPLKNKRQATKEIEIVGELIAPQNSCAICGKEGSMSRVYNMVVYTLCEDCYYHKTLGKLAEAVRRSNG